MKHLEVALRLLALEGADPEAAVRVYARMAARFEPLIGVAGMRAILVRSAKLSVAEYPCFASLAVAPPGSMHTVEDRLQASFGEHEPAPLSAAAALYGKLLGLLTSFIGESLVRQVLRGAFPALEQNVRGSEP